MLLNEPTVADHLLRALIGALVRRGLISEQDLLAAADDMEETGGDAAQDAAHILRWDILKPELDPTESLSDRRAERLRSHIHAVPDSHDGGNEDT